MRRLNRLSLRLRLTLVFAGASALLLAGIGTFLYLEVKSGLDNELDHSLRLRARELATRTGDPAGLRAGLDAAGQPAQVLSRDGRVLASVRVAGARSLVGAAQLPAARDGELTFERDERTRILARPAGGGTIVAVAASMRQRERTLEILGGVLLFGLPIALLLASAAGYAVVGAALRPVDRMRRHAADISHATPDARLPLPPAHDELHRLGETLNDMLGRLGAAAQQEREFVSNASHELRTPLAILKAEIDVALQPDSDPHDWRRGLESAGEEADRLIRLAEDLLLIARGEPGAPARALEEVSLEPLVRRVADRFDGVVVEVAVEPEVAVLAEPHALERALTNLIDNARRYGAQPIRITTTATTDWVELHVLDHGTGFADDYLPHAFERFSRPTGSRAGGAGLGLALVEAVAHAHGGHAGAANAEPGADVWLSLPRAPARASDGRHERDDSRD